jgi:adenylate cyclase
LEENRHVPEIRYLPDDKSASATYAETLLEASLRIGLPHAHACGAVARCSTCRVVVVEGLELCGPRNDAEAAMAQRLHFSPEIRLACQTVPQGDVTVRRMVLDEEDARHSARMAAQKSFASIGEDKEIAILFADIRGFTSFTERLPPYDVVYALNRYFLQMGQAIGANGGHINNYMGDGLMALFGVSGTPDAAFRSVCAGLAMLDAVDKLKPVFREIYDMDFDIGVGIHYGEVVIGSLGAESQQRLTVIGDAVNFASRIEAANKTHGTRLLVSQELYKLVAPRVRAGRRFEAVAIKGKSGSYELIEITAVL